MRVETGLAAVHAASSVCSDMEQVFLGVDGGYRCQKEKCKIIIKWNKNIDKATLASYDSYLSVQYPSSYLTTLGIC
jgi:hypothetical protein